MAKRAPTNEKPFTALDKGLAASVMNPAPVAYSAPSAIESQSTTVLAEPKIREAESTPAVRTVNTVTAREPVIKPKPAGGEHASVEKLSREKRVLLTPSEEREIERCVDRVAEGFGGTPVKLSHVIRACLAVVRHAEGEVIRRAQDVGQLTRPPNGDAVALAEFEHELAKVLSQAFRDAPALR